MIISLKMHFFSSHHLRYGEKIMSLGILLSRQKTTNITDAVSLILHLTTSVCVTVNKATQINNYYIAHKSNESKIHPIKYRNYIV